MNIKEKSLSDLINNFGLSLKGYPSTYTSKEREYREEIINRFDTQEAELAELREDRRILKQIVAVCESPSALYDAIEEARDHLNKRAVAKNATVEEADSND